MKKRFIFVFLLVNFIFGGSAIIAEEIVKTPFQILIKDLDYKNGELYITIEATNVLDQQALLEKTALHVLSKNVLWIRPVSKLDGTYGAPLERVPTKLAYRGRILERGHYDVLQPGESKTIVTNLSKSFIWPNHSDIYAIQYNAVNRRLKEKKKSDRLISNVIFMNDIFIDELITDSQLNKM